MKKEIKLNFNLSSLISHLSSSKGFTLIELLVVILVILSVGVLISSVLFSALRGANKTNTIDLVRRNGNSAITQMSRMIRYSQSFDGVSIDGSPGTYTTSCVPPIAASSASVISSPPPRLGLFPELASLISNPVPLSKLPKDPKQAGVFVYLVGLLKEIFLKTSENFPTEAVAQVGSFPVVQATATSLQTTGTQTHVVSLPADPDPGPGPGDLLIVVFAVTANPVATWPSGWTQFFSFNNGTAVKLAAAYRKADGTEGTTILVTTDTIKVSAHHAYRISGAIDPVTQAPQASIGVWGTSAAPNPDLLTPTGGAKDYLWLAIGAVNSGFPGVITAAPISYANLLVSNSGGSTGSGAGSARRTVNAASENPGAFTLSSDRFWVAATIAVHPAAPPPTPTPTPTPTPSGPTPTPTPVPPTPTPIQYHYARVTGFDGGKTTFHCDSTANFSLGIASNSASLIDTSSVDVSSCYFTCSQDNIFSPPNIGINFSLTQKGNPQFFENRDSASFQTSVSVRNY